MVFGRCENCGAVKEYKYPSIVKRYCSHKCANLASASVRRSKDIETLKCAHCNENFTLLESELRARRKGGQVVKYCSRKCAGLASRTGNTAECMNCREEFYTTRNKFCSRRCSAKYDKKHGLRKRSGHWYENGYRIIYSGNGNGKKEHIKIMEEHMGRKLKHDEVVHHVNGIKSDNRLENLEVMTRGEHSSLHREIELQLGHTLFKSVDERF